LVAPIDALDRLTVADDVEHHRCRHHLVLADYSARSSCGPMERYDAVETGEILMHGHRALRAGLA
jgi:hypothetical protein